MLVLSHSSFLDNDMMYLLAFVFLFFVIVYWHVLRDASDFVEEEQASPDDKMVSLYNLYKTGEIEIASCQQLRGQATIQPTMCSVCLEDFSDNDDVAKLPCGHYFHPLCSHIWIRSHWTCPLRCDIGLQEPSKEKVNQRIEEDPRTNQSASPRLRTVVMSTDRQLETLRMAGSSTEQTLAESDIPPHQSQRAIMERLYSHQGIRPVPTEAAVAEVSQDSEQSAHVMHQPGLDSNTDLEAGLTTICVHQSQTV